MNKHLIITYAALKTTGGCHWIMQLAKGKLVLPAPSLDEEVFEVQTFGLYLLNIFEYLCGYLPVKNLNTGYIRYYNFKKMLYPINTLILYLIFT